MSIIIQFNSPFIQSASGVPSSSPCHSKGSLKVDMVPGIEHSDVQVMTDDELDLATSNSIYVTSIKEVKSSHCYFGLPYQDHNYGAPPPPTPPKCPSPAADIAIADEDTNLSTISTTTDEAVEESVTRCICGFEHDDEYMICCDHCLVWQHVDCMGLDRSSIPETYLCEQCEPRKLDRHKAKLLQARKKNLLKKIPASKQDPTANNYIYAKNYKKKQTLQSAVGWNKGDQVVTPAIKRNYSTSDSDEDNKNAEHRPKTRSKKRKREEEKAEQVTKKSKLNARNSKDRVESKRSKLRRNKNKESTSTADEEAQDAWEYSNEWSEEKPESTIKNQYTPEIHLIARQLNTQGFEMKFYEQMLRKQCHVLDDGKRKRLVCLYDLPRNEPVIEFKGKYMLATQFHDSHPLYNKRLYPYVLFYNVEKNEICVDASVSGNDARFVRRSCKPNAGIRHMTYNGTLHLYLQSTKAIFSEDEVTIPFSLNSFDGHSLKDIECACGRDDCLVKPKKRNGSVEVIQEKRRRSRRRTISADDDSSQSLHQNHEKAKPSPIKESPEQVNATSQESTEQVGNLKATSDHETEDLHSENKKKLTREERKIDAYVKAFLQLEKLEQRKKQAQEKHKTAHPKSEEIEDKSPEAVVSASTEEEEKANTDPHPSESVNEEETKTPVLPSTPKRKSKRRRGSGTPSRRRTRTNSGGSEILSLVSDTLSQSSGAQTSATSASDCSESTAPSTGCFPDPPPPPPPPMTPTSPVTSPVDSSKVPKTKRLLLREWLQVKSEGIVNTCVASPNSIHTEIKWDNTAASAQYYVRCTKDAPHSAGISAAHLRRSNSTGHMKEVMDQSYTKKRWLRQAMHDGTGSEELTCADSNGIEQLESVCLSPVSHADGDSTAAEDIVTPIKKRRVLRESVESPPPKSPVATDTRSNDAEGQKVQVSTVETSEVEEKNETQVGSDDVMSNHLSEISPEETKKESESVAESTEIEEVVKIKEENEHTSGKLPILPDQTDCSNSKCDSNEAKLPESVEEIPTESEIKAEVTDSPSIDGSNSSSIDTFKETAIVDLNTEINSAKCTPGDDDDAINNSPGNDTEDPNTLKVNESEVSEKVITVAQKHSDKSCTSSSSSSVNTSPTNFTLTSPDALTATTSPKLETASPVKLETASPVKLETASPVKLEMASPIKLETFSTQLEQTSSTPATNKPKTIDSAPESGESGDAVVNGTDTDDKEDEIVKPPVNTPDDTSTNGGPPNLTVKVELAKSSADISCNSLVSVSSVVNSAPSPVKNGSENILKKSESPSNKVLCSENILKKSESPGNKVLCSETILKKSESLSNKVLCSETILKKSESPSNKVLCSEKEPSSVNVCASATQKRKVSLSEYRMRMRENTNKVKSNIPAKEDDSAKPTPAPKAVSSVTLKTLPLFKPKEISKILPRKLTLQKTKSESSFVESKPVVDVPEQRENLTERLRREFGFDLTEGSSAKAETTNPLKSKSNNQSSSIPTVQSSSLCTQQPLPPPPPPPPRPPRPAVPGTIPASPYGYVHASYPQPPYMVPQVQNSAYIATPPPNMMPPVAPPVSPIHPNPSPRGIRPPLLPSTHSFSTSLQGPLLRTPTQPEYTPVVNAQRFASLIQQAPPANHKTYPHAYPPGLYK